MGVSISILGLVALAISLTVRTEHGSRGTITGILVWLGASAAVAASILAFGRRRLGSAVAHGLAGGVLFAVGDVSTKIVTEGGVRVAFFVTLVVGYTLGTSLLQIGYQAGGAITVAGLATLMTNALPIAAGTVVLEEGVPGGVLGALRALAFAAVTTGAVVLARPDPQARRDGGSRSRPPPIESQQCGHG